MIIDDTSILVCDVVQSSVCSFFRLFREDLMGLYISVEPGTITNTDLVQLMGNIGLVCILLQNRNIKHLTCIILYNIVYYYCLLLICRGPTNCFDHPLFLVDVKTKNTIKICG